jgi:hypothetical protein
MENSNKSPRAPAAHAWFTRNLRWLCFLLLLVCLGPGRSKALGADASRLSDDAFLDRLEHAAFDYFWNEANPTNGLVRDRSTPESKSSIAAVGFGLSAINVAIERGWITREAGRARVAVTLQTFLNGAQSDQPSGIIGTHGWFYHFLEMDTAVRAWRCELSSIDTILFLAGAIDSAQFFDRPFASESRIRSDVQQLIGRVDWNWMANRSNSFSMGWHPETGFIARRWIGYNEAMILYLIALGAVESGVVAASNSAPLQVSWEAWTEGYQWRTNYGQAYIEFPPLFGHQYSHCWVDFRGITDAWLRPHQITYFENSRRATLAQQAYCISASGRFHNYGPLEWGITSSDGPHGYSGRGSPPAENDDGTIAPTAVGGSLPFAPEVCLPTLRHLDAEYGDRLWTRYGFRDAYNRTGNWWGPDVLGIDQGPILIMAENYRTGAVWRRMHQNKIIRSGLKKAGFRPLKSH